MSQTPDTLSPIDSADTLQRTATLSGERADLLDALRKHRGFLRFAVKELTDEQARTRTTVSELTLGGLVKHVAEVEAQWATFMVEGAGSAPDIDWESIDWANPPAEVAAFADSHRLLGRRDPRGRARTLRGGRTAHRRTRRDARPRHRPRAARRPPGSSRAPRWSVRRAVLHILAETSQHAGHADIIRESLDGQKTMG